MGERPDLAGRVAWTYLATLLAGAIGGLVALVVFQVVNPLQCTAASDEAAEQAVTCSLVWGMGLLVLGFAAAFIGALRLLKVEGWLCAWLAMVAGMLALLVLVGWIGYWWWWVAAALLPALAALASASWSGETGFRRAQYGILAGLSLGLLGLFVWQVLAG